MSKSSRQIIPDGLVNLLFTTGMLLVLVSLPMGIFLALQSYRELHYDWRWAILAGVVVTIGVALVGSLFYSLGKLIVRQRRKVEEEMARTGAGATSMKTATHRHTGPDTVSIERGAKFWFQVENIPESPGVVVRGVPEDGRWRYETQPKRSVYSPFNLLKKPDFVVADGQGQEVLRVRRSGRFPARFEMLENGQSIGKIVLRSILRNKYTIEFKDGSIWTFHMPLFTIYFSGESTVGSHVWVMVGPSKREWNLLFETGAEDKHLAFGLAFIHREWWCYS